MRACVRVCVCFLCVRVCVWGGTECVQVTQQHPNPAHLFHEAVALQQFVLTHADVFLQLVFASLQGIQLQCQL